MDLVQHHIETIKGVVARSRPYRLPEHKKQVVQDELKAMLELGVLCGIEVSQRLGEPDRFGPFLCEGVRCLSLSLIQCLGLTSCMIG